MSSRTFLSALGLVAVSLVAWELRWVLLVLFGAVVIGVALDVPITLVRRLIPLNRPTTLALVLTVVILLGLKVGDLLLPELTVQGQEFTRLIPTMLRELGDSAAALQLSSLEEQISQWATWDKLQPLGLQVLGLAGGAANSTLQLLLMVLLAVLLALDPRSHQRLLVAITPGFYRPRMKTLLHDCREALGGWLGGMTLSAVTVFLATWAGLSLLKVPLALLSALVCGLLTFVPTVGPTVGTILPVAVALSQSPALALQVLVLRLVIQNAEAFLLTPVLLSRTVNLLPTVALMAQLCLGTILGLPGVLLALPLVVVMQVMCSQILVEDIMDRWQTATVPFQSGLQSGPGDD
jgi:predicted PurR-regulated permease PerM